MRLSKSWIIASKDFAVFRKIVFFSFFNSRIKSLAVLDDSGSRFAFGAPNEEEFEN